MQFCHGVRKFDHIPGVSHRLSTNLFCFTKQLCGFELLKNHVSVVSSDLHEPTCRHGFEWPVSGTNRSTVTEEDETNAGTLLLDALLPKNRCVQPALTVLSVFAVIMGAICQ